MGAPRSWIRTPYEFSHDAALSRVLRDVASARPVSSTRSLSAFSAEPGHPGLRFKQVWNDPPTYSARVGISYRAVGALDGDTVIWFWFGTHADYDKLLESL